MSVRESSRAGTFAFRIFNTFIMTVIVIATLYPFWYILVSSFSSISHIIGSQIILWPDGIHLDAYRQIFRNNLIPNAYKTLMSYMKINGICHKEDEKVIACFEKSYEKDNHEYMDVYIAAV